MDEAIREHKTEEEKMKRSEFICRRLLGVGIYPFIFVEPLRAFS
jgi:hypothetical protein